MDSGAVTVARTGTVRGELVLRESGGHYEVISNGVFLMDTRAGESERLLVRAALDAVPPGSRLLIGGLGVGFSLAEAAASPRPAEIVVVEIEPALVGWHRGPLGRFSAGALDDPRVRVVTADIVTWLAGTAERFDAICLDVDNGPDWTVFDTNARLYGGDGLALLRARLAPGGVLAVWSASASPAYAARLAEAVGPVRMLAVEVARGEPDVVYLARNKAEDPV
ncbi:spermidine synthase [Catellatospora sp. IY07-71]|uniref:spermine/spermidine synthase domain-containing protein n=1 Tax=Catellatospora sp. IY07-71 TaxID=2728827 RepID=UPI001BB4557E|nr:spermidine synthase [Catellatospora sp. IY07-71]BCJ73258.1 spermidine synthase [Catellatospora sp. IY07-71]